MGRIRITNAADRVTVPPVSTYRKADAVPVGVIDEFDAPVKLNILPIKDSVNVGVIDALDILGVQDGAQAPGWNMIYVEKINLKEIKALESLFNNRVQTEKVKFKETFATLLA